MARHICRTRPAKRKVNRYDPNNPDWSKVHRPFWQQRITPGFLPNVFPLPAVHGFAHGFADTWTPRPDDPPHLLVMDSH